MKKFPIALIISALCLNFLPAAEVAVETDEEENLLVNGSFEEPGKDELTAKSGIKPVISPPSVLRKRLFPVNTA